MPRAADKGNTAKHARSSHASTRAKPSTIDEYLAPLPAAQRTALQRLRKTVRATVPAAEECISYGLPTFRLDGKAFFYFGAAAHHCAIYGALDKAFADELAGFETNGKGTIRFQPSHPLPSTLVAKLVRARLARMQEKTKATAVTRPARAKNLSSGAVARRAR